MNTKTAKTSTATKTEMKKPEVKETESVSTTVIANINGINVENDTVLKYQESNPKRAGSKAHQRFEVYMKAKTVEEFLKFGGLKADLRYDDSKGFVEIESK